MKTTTTVAKRINHYFHDIVADVVVVIGRLLLMKKLLLHITKTQRYRFFLLLPLLPGRFVLRLLPLSLFPLKLDERKERGLLSSVRHCQNTRERASERAPHSLSSLPLWPPTRAEEEGAQWYNTMRTILKKKEKETVSLSFWYVQQQHKTFFISSSRPITTTSATMLWKLWLILLLFFALKTAVGRPQMVK
jgi:hypothetical protein